MILAKSLSNPIKCIIVDDDPFMQDLLKDKLRHCCKVQILAVSSSATEAIEKIQKLRPELVFLDVEMPDMTGFEMLEQFDRIDFKVIFVTSYSHYAIKAIRFSALDYILKPIDLQDLRNAVRRFLDTRNDDDARSIRTAIRNHKTSSPADRILTLKSQDGELQFPVKEILYVEGYRNYSFIHNPKEQRTLVSKTLIALEEILDGSGFFRCHKSYLVNRLHLASQLKRDSIELKGGIKLPVSRRRYQAFKDWIESSEGEV